MCTTKETVVTTTSITAVSVSMRSAQATASLPEVNQLAIGTCASAPPATWKNAIQDRTKQIPRNPVVTYSAPRAPIQRPKRPAIRKPKSGRKTIRSYIGPSALQRIDVFDRDRAAVAVIGDQDRKADRRFRRRDSQNEQCEGLARQVAREGREGDQIDVDRQQNQLDRHQNDDDVLVVEDDAGDADREHNRREDQIGGKVHSNDPSDADARGYLAQLDRGLGRAGHLGADVLTLDAGLVLQGDDDRADHGGEQDHARRLEEVEVAGVEHFAERGGVGERAGRRRGRGGLGRGGPARHDVDELGADDEGDQQALRQVLDEPLLHAGEVHVEQHDDEQEQHSHSADVDDDQDHRQELRPHDEKEPSRTDEGENQEQHGVNRVSRYDDRERRHDEDRREYPEKNRLGHLVSLLKIPAPAAVSPIQEAPPQSAGRGIAPSPKTCYHPSPSLAKPVVRTRRPATPFSRARDYRYGAFIAMLRASSRSQRAPFASSRSLS